MPRGTDGKAAVNKVDTGLLDHLLGPGGVVGRPDVNDRVGAIRGGDSDVRQHETEHDGDWSGRLKRMHGCLLVAGSSWIGGGPWLTDPAGVAAALVGGRRRAATPRPTARLDGVGRRPYQPGVD